MPGFCGFPKELAPDYDSMMELLDPLSENRDTVASTEYASHIFTANGRSGAPLNGSRLYSDDDWIMVFAGDMVGKKDIPYQEFARILSSASFEQFSACHGIWALAALNKRDKQLFLVSDRTGQHPLYYHRGGGAAVIFHPAAGILSAGQSATVR